ncbi:protocadherin gamma-A6-like isoform X15 [Carcharodon carcharias]|uniref:protocadherin gamma-A6-like isoform X15 n=1 Tax=Carcharodon carcharias TaxID=13397 RepID=UPI001B7F2676|nr:protocadherin gamma-A6-like isoform X15 [Carcharodon carcharias]
MGCYKIYYLVKWQLLYSVFPFWVLVSGQIRYSIPEELRLGAFVGNIAGDLGLDVEELSARNFRIVPGPRKSYLDVNLDNGILFVKEKIDREQLCGSSPTCLLSLEAVIENPLNVYRVEVEVLDVNDNIPHFPKSQIRLEISEVAAPGARFPLECAQDPDVGTNSLQSYRLVGNRYFALDIESRSGDEKLPVLMLERPLDREKESTHRLELIAKDGGDPPRSSTAQIIIVVQDANDNSPVFSQSGYRVSLNENVPQGTLVIKLNATDLDDGANGEIEYSFTSHTSATVRQLFGLDSKTGEIRVKGNLDYEENSAFDINVQAIDKGSAALPVYCHVHVDVTDANDNSPEVIVTSLFSPVREDAVPGTVVALISTRDKDSGENGQVHCQIPNNLPFELSSPLKDYYKLLIQEQLDRENTSKYDIAILCSDSGSTPLTSKKTVQVEISDVNDNAPRFKQSAYTAYVMENNIIGASIFSVTASDPDFNENARLSYSIPRELIQDESVANYVYINAEDGILFSQRTFDYEELKDFQLWVQARDSGVPPLSNNVSVVVVILDQNDNAPVILHPLPEYGSTVTETMSRFAEPGYLVTKVSAIDADSGQNARLSYQITQATDPGLFTISPDTGEIWTVRGIGDKDATKQRLTIVVKDNGTPPLSASMTISLSVIDGDTQLLSDVSNLTEDPGFTSGLSFYLVISLGIISSIFLVKQPNADWRFSQTHRAELNSSQYLEEEGVQRDIQREVQREVQCDVQREVPRDVQCDASRNIQREVQHDMQCDVQHVVEKDPGGPRKPMCARPAAIPAGRDGWTLPRTAPRMQLQMTLGTHVPGTLRSQYLLPRGVHTSGARISNSSVEFSAPLIGSLHGPWAANQTRDHRGISSSGGRRPELDTQACGEIPCSPPGQRLSTQCLHSRDHHHPLREVNY